MTLSASRRSDTPGPEDSTKPDSPGDIKKPSWLYVVRRTFREFSKDQCTDLAAALTYYSVLALFPAMIALLSLVGLVGQGPKTVDTLLGILSDVGAKSAAHTLEPTLTTLSHTPGPGIALTIGLASALWSASGYVGSFGRAMNRIYQIGEGRPFWKLRPVMMLVTLTTVILCALVALGLIVSGPAAQSIGSAIGLGSTSVLIWNITKWPLLLVTVVLIVALLYYSAPNVKQPKFKWMSVGALIAIIAWLLASAAFGIYVANFSSYNKTYGSLAGVIVFLLWLWITNLALLFGAELDAELERGRQLQAGIPAEETLQLPPRDTRNIDKADAKQNKDIQRGKRLRESRAKARNHRKVTTDNEGTSSKSAKILCRPLGLTESGATVSTLDGEWPGELLHDDGAHRAPSRANVQPGSDLGIGAAEKARQRVGRARTPHRHHSQLGTRQISAIRKGRHA